MGVSRRTVPSRLRGAFALVVALPALAGLYALTVPAPGKADETTCPQWQMSTVTSGLGSLENLVFDRQGGLLVSASTQDAILRVSPDGEATTLIPDVNSPGGLRIRDGRRDAILYFNTGDSLASGLNNVADGTIDRYRFASGKRTTWAKRLTMPNGLAFLPGGDAVVSRDFGDTTGITRVPLDDPKHPQTNWADLHDSNGIAISRSGRWLYTVETFTLQSRVYRVRIAKPSRVDVVAELGGSPPPKGLDDMTRDRDSDLLFITANAAGEVIQLDPDTGDFCVIASGLQNPSSTKFGRGAGWSRESLYVTGFDGTVRQLTPPQ